MVSAALITAELRLKLNVYCQIYFQPNIILQVLD